MAKKITIRTHCVLHNVKVTEGKVKVTHWVKTYACNSRVIKATAVMSAPLLALNNFEITWKNESP